MKQHILKYVTIICTLIILVVGVAASSARAERALSPELKLGLAPSLTPALAPEGRWGAEVGEVTADVPQELVNEEFDRWTLGGGFIYWATGCSIPSPDDGPTGGANAAESADDITAPQAVNNHYLLRRLPIGGGTPVTLVSASHANCETFRFLTADDSGAYYYNKFLSRLEMFPVSAQPGTTPTVVRNNVTDVEVGLYLDNTHVYYATSADKIRRAAKDGSGGGLVHNTGFNVKSMAVDKSGIYWIDSSGLSWGSKGCSSPPCAKEKLNGATGTRIILGEAGLGGSLSTVYMVRPGVSQTIRSYNCSIISGQPNICSSTLHYDGPSFTSIGLPAWAKTGGLFQSKKWLVWPELLANEGRLRQKELDTDTEVDRYSGPKAISPIIFIEGGNIYFADKTEGSEKIMRIPLIGQAIERDLAYGAMEVTQAIQNLDNDVPLVADKPTYVRVYGRKVSGVTAGGVEAELHGSWNGQALAGSPLTPIQNLAQLLSANEIGDRTQEEVGWLFRLPASWTAATTNLGLRAVVDPRQLYDDTNRSNNFSNPTFVTFNRKWQQCDVFVPIDTDRPLPSAVDNPHAIPMIKLSENLLPVPRVVAYQRNTPLEKVVFTYVPAAPGELFGHHEVEYSFYDLGEQVDQKLVLGRLERMANSSDQPPGCGDQANTLYIGMAHATSDTTTDKGVVGGSAFLNSKSAWLKMSDPNDDPRWSEFDYPGSGITLAHEEGHSYGRQHVACPKSELARPANPDPNYPYDTCQLDDLVPPDPAAHVGFHSRLREPIAGDIRSDIMSYGIFNWTSPYTWKCLFWALEPGSGDCPQEQDNQLFAPAALGAVQTEATVMVSGIFSPTEGTGELDYAWLFPNDAVSTAVRQRWQEQTAVPWNEQLRSAVADPDVHLRLLAADGTVLDDRVVLLDEEESRWEEEGPQTFMLNFPAPDGSVAKVQLLAGDQVVNELTPGAQPPNVTILQPAGGEQVDEAVTAAWRATDADGDPLRFTVQYSPDMGSSWFTLALEVGSESDESIFRLNLGGMPGSPEGKAQLRVLASDGYHTTIAISQPFTPTGHKPWVGITSPVNGEIVPAGQGVELSGQAVDDEDGPLAVENMEWSLDGVTVGNGSDQFIAGLTPGGYQATLSAEDAAGQMDQAETNFTVAPLSVPDGGGLNRDGFCDDSNYSDAVQVPLMPYADGGQPIAYLLHSSNALWVCINGLQKGGEEAISQAGLRLDLDRSRDAAVGDGDLLFMVGEDGTPLQQVGDAGGNLINGGPEGLAATVAASGDGWQAEMRIPDTALGDWNRVVGLLLSHEMRGEITRWPHAASASAPHSWATTVLGARPQIESLDPNSADVNGDGFALGVTGLNFVDGSVVSWNGETRPTTFVDATHLTANIGTADLAQGGKAEIRVVNPGLETTPSDLAYFAIDNPLPTLDSISPDTAQAGSGSVQLTVLGEKFVPGSQFLWNGVAKPAVLVSSGELSVTLAAADLIVPGLATVAVYNPGPGGGSSNTLSFTVTPAGKKYTAFMPWVVYGQ